MNCYKKIALTIWTTLMMTAYIYAQAPVRVTVKLPGGKAPESPIGPIEATWESIRAHYHTPEWFIDGKFGIFIHWGVYSVPASGSEWYPRHMYNAMLKEHTERWGSPDKFGYKDFIPLFKAEKFNADEWLALFKEAGATYIIPTAEHHDGFAMYDCKYSRWNSVLMGPKRDIIGELKKAADRQGIKFGVSNHRIEHWDFMYPEKAKQHDLFDPQYADFYGPPQQPQPGNSAMGPSQEEIMNGIVKQAPQSREFLEEWLARCEELIDKYQPDLFYMDNGINSRSLDSVKLRLAKYYYNSACQWNKSVSLTTKSDAYLEGTIRDYERMSRAPQETPHYYWQVDDPIGHKFGYVEGLKLQDARHIIRNLIHNISHNGNLCLNVSPKSDGTIPEDQQKILREVGAWLKINGRAVYGSRTWTTSGEVLHIEKYKKEVNIRFTRSKDEKTVYAFLLDEFPENITLCSFTPQKGEIKSVTSLAGNERLKYSQTNQGLHLFGVKTSTDEMPVVIEIKLE